jgi:hypothetical protein
MLHIDLKLMLLLPLQPSAEITGMLHHAQLYTNILNI